MAGSGDLVGLVVVSHSRALARAAVELASQMLHGSPVPIAVAAGLDEQTLGTDAVAIQAAIEEVAGPAGVVVLMDLGSAVLSAELALELLSDTELRDRVVLSAAPLVEGLVVAAVAAAGGAGRQEVAAEAGRALMGKVAQLEAHSLPPETEEPSNTEKPPHPGKPSNADKPWNAGEPASTGSATEAVAEFTVTNRHGLHARPAALLVSALRGLDAQVGLRNLTTGAGPLPAASLSKVAILGALHGHRVQVLAAGRQAREALDRVLELAGRRFDEPVDESPEPARTQQTGPLPASPGIGIGPVRQLGRTGGPAARAAGDRAQPGRRVPEGQRVTEALAAVRREIERYRALAEQAGPHQARIFDAHLLLLEDEELLADIKARLDAGADAVAACADAVAVVERQWAQLPDPYLRARAEDVRAIGAQLVAALTGTTAVALSGPGILVAAELTPGQVADLDAGAVQGIVLAYGSPTSHAAILARSRGIPALVGAGAGVLELAEGSLIALDGATGELVLDPPEATVARFRGRAAELADRNNRNRAAAGAPACTVDGIHIEVAANLGSHADALVAAANGADGAGLVRTEFLFLHRGAAPDRDEQAAHYLGIAEAMAGRRVTLRTLDVGGDKPLSYLPVPVEDNPYLGRRGIRLSLQRRELLQDQLAAICDVARQAPVSVMFPMVSTVSELRDARQVLDDAAGPAGLPDGLRVGMMVEVPAAALKIARFLPYLDFVSIGTNDLTQYTLAAERGNAAVAALADPLDPGVLSLIAHVCRTAAGLVPVAVCGEAAAEELSIPVLIGLGVSELSVSARSVPAVKARVRELDLERCRSLARSALEAEDAASVRELVSSTLPAGSLG
ncbi:phosphoenolpyruvate--protein phosphotransferase [Jatrophihabitans sp.]|uniref:phosphoenolpyruvate--protein phosphotransferase n=1 Tax=Jatrophihabitans sp. TaxID=1932789 RepID=UPI002F185576